MRQQPRSAHLPISPAGYARIALRILVLLLLVGLCVPLHYALQPFTRRNPTPRLFLAGVARTLGVTVETTGERPRRGSFLVANHVSWLDIPAIASVSDSAFIAQDGLAAIGWLRWLCSLNDTVFVARDRPGRVSDQVDQVRGAIRESKPLTIFPEGTTGDGQDLLPFKSSLLSALCPVPKGITVQPIWMDYGARSCEIAWIGDEPGKDSFLKIAARRHRISLTIHFLAPLEGETLADRKTIAAAARTAIGTAMEDAFRPARQRVAL